MGWEQAAKGFPELGKHHTLWNRWYNHAVTPLFAAIGMASLVCGGYLTKYFSGNTDIRFSKSLRGSHEVGLSEKRITAHNSHFGLRSINKNNFKVWPFTWCSVDSTIEKHRFDK
mmetsp:Transcript_28921/g.48012  ORF Transcript_28921/g.48012 Transcript_28921/m.48012 type:complete len:114 (-) Transcript_28921:336-677(-)